MTTTASSKLVEFRAVSKVYGTGDAKITALDRVNFSIRSGEFVAIVGASGSGKSTAMNILGCLDIPTAGDYLVAGVSTSGYSRQQRTLLRRHLVGFVFQGFHLLPRTTALENVELPLIYRGIARAKRRTLAIEALDRVGLKAREDHTPQQLSGGQQQRVAIARAIVTNPEIILADEPTGNLDSKTSVEIMALFKRLNSELGATVVMITHDTAMANYARRVLRFSDGHLEAQYLKRHSCNAD